jgi:hypothetical protein
MKKSRQPIASARTPVTGPVRIRGSEKRAKKSAYCVAENLF